MQSRLNISAVTKLPRKTASGVILTPTNLQSENPLLGGGYRAFRRYVLGVNHTKPIRQPRQRESGALRLGRLSGDDADRRSACGERGSWSRAGFTGPRVAALSSASAAS